MLLLGAGPTVANDEVSKEEVVSAVSGVMAAMAVVGGAGLVALS